MISINFGPPPQPMMPMVGMNRPSPAGQMMMMAQMMQIMLGLMSMMMGGRHSMPLANPGFGGMPLGGGSSATPAAFLGMPYGMNGGSGSSSGSSANFGSAAGASGAAGSAGSPQSAGGGYIKPLDGNFRISSTFGPRRAPTAGASTDHKGIDLAAPTGTPVRAVKSGRISISKSDPSGYGNWVEVKHDDGTSSRYAHLHSRGAQVGQRVEQGQVIGTVGNTGTSTGAHLHFEIRNAQGQPVDPQKVMNF